MCNISRQNIIEVAEALQDSLNQIVFVGGSITEFYIDNPDIKSRPTKDIDIVIEMMNRSHFNKIEEYLRSKGFKNDMTENAPLCRWIYKGIQVDVMPHDESIMGFTNKWYEPALKSLIQYEIKEGLKINIFSPEYYLATKMEAILNRGLDELKLSTDLEDFILIFDGNKSVMDLLSKCPKDMKDYFKESFETLFYMDDFEEAIEWVLPYGMAESKDRVLSKITSLYGI